MKKSKATKRTLLLSVLAMLLCMVMLVGTTFAWFTDTASTGVNKIVSGNLKVDIIGADSDSHIEKLNFTKAATTDDEEAGASLGFLVVAQVIGDAVGQLAGIDGRVGGQSFVPVDGLCIVGYGECGHNQ